MGKQETLETIWEVPDELWERSGRIAGLRDCEESYAMARF